MAINPALFSSDSQEWATPPQAFAFACKGYPLPVLDVCATPANSTCGSRYYDKETNALIRDWSWARVCWMNPPYGRKIGDWIAKANYEAGKGATVICLLPARTDTKWWHDYVEPIRQGEIPGEVRFIRGRVKFVGAPASAPFPSVVVIFRSRLPELQG